MTASKERCDVQATVTNLLEQPSVAGFVLNCRDISERLRYEASLSRMAFHDELTGLPNRAYFMNKLETAVESMLPNESLALLLIDVDHFKRVNDTLGHAAGDDLIREVAQRLTAALPEATIARFGGDEFAILLHDQDRTRAELAADVAVHSFDTPFSFEGQTVPVTLSIGVEIVSDGDSPHDAFRNADIAMYHAKSAGGGTLKLADQETYFTWARQRQIEQDLPGVAERGELKLLYQPIVSLPDGQLSAAEALLRWEHPRLGLLSPDQFIPRAEATGDIIQIGQWVRETALRAMSGWRNNLAHLAPNFAVHVNLSTVELEESDLIECVSSTLADGDYDPSHLVIEVTESRLMHDVDLARTRLTALRNLGVRIALDDFGTGYSSLAFVREMPVQTLKIDRQFVVNVARDARALQMVEAIARLAESLDLDLVAEGIEDHAQLSVLERIGCSYGQGYYLGRPVESHIIEELLQAQLSDERAAA